MRGCIIVGYQGIGKSTLANQNWRVIDLESSSYWITPDTRLQDWYISYVNTAVHLANQGYIVFVSSHEVVYRYLASLVLPNNVESYVCYPIPELKDEWISKLESRYTYTGLDKDYKAWKNAEDRYLPNIDELRSCGLKKIPIYTIDYDLVEVLTDAEYFDYKLSEYFNYKVVKSDTI